MACFCIQARVVVNAGRSLGRLKERKRRRRRMGIAAAVEGTVA